MVSLYNACIINPLIKLYSNVYISLGRKGGSWTILLFDFAKKNHLENWKRTLSSLNQINLPFYCDGSTVIIFNNLTIIIFNIFAETCWICWRIQRQIPWPYTIDHIHSRNSSRQFSVRLHSSFSYMNYLSRNLNLFESGKS